MNNDLISREALKKAMRKAKRGHYAAFSDVTLQGIYRVIDNAPTVIPEEFKPIIDKVVDILPELTNAIIEQLPQIISSNIKCSECSYYKDTWNVIPRPQGEWIKNAEEWQRIDPPYFCSECGHANLRKTPFCEMCGADMRSES